MTTRILCLLLLLNTFSLRAQDKLSFTSSPFAFCIGAPLTWKLLPASFPTEDYELQNKNLFDLVKKERSIPIVRIVKPVADNRTISPAVQVFVESAEGQAPTDFLVSASESAAAGYENFQIVHKASDTTLNGIRAAYMESTFVTAYSGGRRFATLSRLWAVPRDKMMFVIAVSGQPEDLKALTNEIEMILGTVRFTNQ
jgi:hypothetical protein